MKYCSVLKSVTKNDHQSVYYFESNKARAEIQINFASFFTSKVLIMPFKDIIVFTMYAAHYDV